MGQMGVFEMVVAIVALAVTGGILKSWIRARSQGAAGKQELEELGARMDRLETRTQNLETIVLNEERAREYEQLRT